MQWKFFSTGLVVAIMAAGAMGQKPASSAGKTPQLVDPAVAKMADGVERWNAGLGARESYLPVLFPSSHAANLLELKNGDVLCVWFSGSWEGNSEVGIMVSRRPAGSRDWGPARLIDSEVGASYQNPVLFEEPDGMLDLFHTTQPAGGGENNAQVLHLVSKDHGQNWSKPEVLFAKPGAYSRHPLVILDDGAWLLPMTYVTSAGIGKGAETNYSVAEISRDQGKSWRECPMADSQGKVQPTVVKLAGGGLRAFFRSRAADAIWTSTSADGCQWSPVEKTALPNNNASVQAFGLPDGHIAMVFDNSSRATGGLRKPLSVALSEDGGKSWPYVRDIEAGRPGFGMAEMRSSQPGREEYSYPSILETRQGEILVAFTYRRQTIKVVSFNEDWIRQRGSVGEYKGRQ